MLGRATTASPRALFAYAAALAPSASPKGRAIRCTVLGFTSNLAAVLRTLMPPARAALIRSANLSAIGGRPSRLPSRLARCRPALGIGTAFNLINESGGIHCQQLKVAAARGGDPS